jgi:hypothetical protein
LKKLVRYWVRCWESKRKGLVSWEKDIDKEVVVMLLGLGLGLLERGGVEGSMLLLRRFSKEVLEVERSESRDLDLRFVLFSLLFSMLFSLLLFSLLMLLLL